ncbi:MAG: hypothetical protein F6J98_22245 [Moorea sp. SIO4G2]|uniref:hypothetical protein n=1 Tax=Moorena TaxID=1155738 RepID=UPI000A66BBD3|nr:MULTISPECIES: hypothetical protein [Moorena]NEO49384.1 hypothetical protein [Moorena sp. SIO4A3]NEO63010.1 hypothetical protein [Moorena sp. SIO4G2]NEO16189.1 hypothetical protein [Moorena sp. SIO3E8]NEP27557.1 hypothetical protein [Moorena sp. SIO3I6]NEQ02718.1 hypothetical protein [Moorena sp. SIO3F7]
MYSLFPIPYSLLPAPYSLFPIPYSLKPRNLYLMSIIIARKYKNTPTRSTLLESLGALMF